MSDKPYINVSSDKYFNDPDHLSGLGVDVNPININGGYVPTRKDEPLDKTQESIRARFKLGGEE